MNSIRWVILLVAIGVQANTIKDKAIFLYQNSYYAEARVMVQNYLSEFPSDLEVVELAGDIAIAQENWSEAITYFEKLARLNPNNADYQYKYGGSLGMKALRVSKWQSLSYLGDMRRSFEKSIQLDSYHLGAYWALISYHCEVPVILGGNKKQAYKLAQSMMKISTFDGLLAYAFLARHEGKNDLFIKLNQQAYSYRHSKEFEEQMKVVYTQITYKNKFRFNDFIKFTEKYRPDAVSIELL